MKAFIIFKDRVTYGKQCAGALRAAGLDVVISDHGTTWPPAMVWLDAEEANGTVVLRRGPGMHPRSLWDSGDFRDLCGDERYVVTDPDVIPSDDCPPDWPQHLAHLLDELPFGKAGLGLRLDRIPETYEWHEKVTSWEQQFWQQEQEGYGAYVAGVDTTLALYQPLPVSPVFRLDALRSGHPYVADHLSWYEDLDNLDAELLYYHQHADHGISHWTFRSRSAWT